MCVVSEETCLLFRTSALRGHDVRVEMGQYEPRIFRRSLTRGDSPVRSLIRHCEPPAFVEDKLQEAASRVLQARVSQSDRTASTGVQLPVSQRTFRTARQTTIAINMTCVPVSACSELFGNATLSGGDRQCTPEHACVSLVFRHYQTLQTAAMPHVALILTVSLSYNLHCNSCDADCV